MKIIAVLCIVAPMLQFLAAFECSSSDHIYNPVKNCGVFSVASRHGRSILSTASSSRISTPLEHLVIFAALSDFSSCDAKMPPELCV